MSTLKVLPKIKLKDVPDRCPKCGGFLSSGWCKGWVTLGCIGNPPDFNGCGWEAEYEILEPCINCKYFTYTPKLIDYEYEDENFRPVKTKIEIKTNQYCLLHNRPTTWDDHCDQFRRKEVEDVGDS